MTAEYREAALPTPIPITPPPLSDDEIRARYPEKNLIDLADPNRPPRRFLVADFIAEGAYTAIVAKSGQGKSTTLRSLCLAVAAGFGDFGGLDIQRRHRPHVLYLDYENGDDDWADDLEEVGLDDATLARAAGRLHIIDRHVPHTLDTEAGGRELADLARAYGLGPGDLIALDSIQRIAGGPENDADTWRLFHRSTVMPLTREHGFTLVALDNTGKDASLGARGSQAKQDACDKEWTLTRSGAYVKVKGTKNRIRTTETHTFERRQTTEGIRYVGAVDKAAAMRRKVYAWADDLVTRGETPSGRALVADREALFGSWSSVPSVRQLRATLGDWHTARGV